VETQKEKLKGKFEKYGEIQSCEVMEEGKGKSKGFGFVCFQDPKSAVKAASELHQFENQDEAAQENPEESKK
jgi:polyadenylate-binding protein